MRTAFDTPLSHTPFAMFCCRLDSRLTLIGRDDQLTDLLGVGSSGQPSEALLDYICDGYAARTYQDVTRQLSSGTDVEFVSPSIVTAVRSAGCWAERSYAARMIRIPIACREYLWTSPIPKSNTTSVSIPPNSIASFWSRPEK